MHLFIVLLPSLLNMRKSDARVLLEIVSRGSIEVPSKYCETLDGS